MRDWARVDGDRPAAHRFAARIYEDMGAIDLAAEAAARGRRARPDDASEWARLGRLRLRLMDRAGAIDALRRAQSLEPTVEALLDLALALQLAGDIGGEVSVCEQAVELEPRVGRRVDAPGARARAHRPGHRVPRGLRARARARRRRRGADLRERMREGSPA